jgi:CubicO group peptidase (beta-lactamase class C family)
MTRTRLAAAALLLFAGFFGVRLHAFLAAASGINAKVLCSAVFVSGRSLEEARANSLRVAPPAMSVRLDEERREVRVEVAGLIRRTARHYGDQGCIALPRGVEDVAFTPVEVRSALADPRTQQWPMGDAEDPPDGAAGDQVDRGKLGEALDLAFADPADRTAAFLVVHRGRIAAERYAPGIHRDTQLESWSMGKSLTATLIGRLIQEGLLSLDAPAPISEWRSPDDPRRKISVADLLRMSSGLEFSGASPSLVQALIFGVPDHLWVYTGIEDVFRFALASPAEHPPGRVGRYRNCDPLALGAILRRTVEAGGEDYLSWPQRALFDRIGIRRQILETDVRGNFILTGFDYGPARNWARLGLLSRRDGVWNGESLLPEGFVRFVATPAPAWEEPVYGGSFRINGTGRYSLPPGAFYMSGNGGQRVFVVPAHDLVIVRMGHTRGGATADTNLRAAQSLILEAIRTPKDPV